VANDAKGGKMKMREAKPGDIYIDKDNKLWRVIGTCDQPTVDVEELEPAPQPNPALIHQALQQMQQPATLPLPPRRRMGGGVSGLMWGGFKRIWTQE
jgi:hypothetical protein